MSPRHVNVEFVSANPTGPLHIGNARGAFVGDLLCRVLEGAGHQVTREYYFNDHGAQIDRFVNSLIAAAKGLEAAPFYIEQESPLPAGGWPQPARLRPNLPNNHLQYVITWYGLAAALLLVSIAWAVGRRRGDRSEAGLIADSTRRTNRS